MKESNYTILVNHYRFTLESTALSYENLDQTIDYAKTILKFLSGSTTSIAIFKGNFLYGWVKREKRAIVFQRN